MNIKSILKELSESSGVSGHEGEINKLIKEYFSHYVDHIRNDNLGNLICLKKGNGKTNKKIMLAAHMDEIGLMVKDIDDNGYIRFTNIGGIDYRTLLYQEVIIHGNEKVFGIIGMQPPSISSKEKFKEAIKMEDMFIDSGLGKKELNSLINIGDVITIKRDMTVLLNQVVAGKSLDDRAGIVALYVCLRELQALKHDLDVYVVGTVQEEVGTRGAITSTYSINPDIGIAIDVGFGHTPELDKFDTLEIAQGPAITIGANIHPKIFEKIKEIAIDNYIDYQIEVAPGPTGTDAWPMQVSREGVATGLLSIPLKYMHTSVETISLDDIIKTGKLLAKFIISLNGVDMEELLCY